MPLNPSRTVAELKELRALTGDENGAQRVAFTPVWVKTRAWLQGKLAGLPVETHTDAAGNLWTTLRGKSNRELLMGGHMDSVPNGGWLDGCLNVMAGVEVLRRINEEYKGKPPVTVRVVDWADEEGARFGKSLFGSSACSGALDMKEARGLKDKQGITLPDALKAVGVDFEKVKDSGKELKNAAAYLELHIEQGPVLLDLGLPLGAVLGTFGVERHAITFHGQAAHSGSTPMNRRKDAFLAAGKMSQEIYKITDRHGGVCTIGSCTTKPGIVTSVVEECRITLDQRHLDAKALAKMLQEAKAASERFAKEGNVKVSWERLWQIEPRPFHPELVEMCDAAIKETVPKSHRLPSAKWQDFDSLGASGKWALILRDGPPKPAGSDPYEPYRSLRKKAQTAKDNGAAGILFVSGEELDKEDGLMKLSADQGINSIGIPVLHIRRNLADRILQESGTTLAELQKKLDLSLQPASMTLACSVEAQAEVLRKMGRTCNVVALLPGSDPLLKEEYVVIGAHYDHLGLGGPGSGSRRPDTVAVHNGADDNASGVAGMLELAEKWAAQPEKPKRSLFFIAFAGEEMGLLGSKYFVNNPLIDLDHIQLMINLDMVGRLNEESRSLSVGGTGTAAGLAELVQNSALKYNLHPALSPEGYGPSDHASFYGKDISVLFFMTSISEEYHTPDDDVDRINSTGEKAVLDLVYSISREVANRTDRLVFQEAGPKTQPAASRRFKVTLGIMPDFTASGIKGLRADAVMPDRPAARAGMKKGDIIVAMDGKPVNDIYEYMNRLADFHSGQRISMEILRGGSKQILIVEL